jgi:rfaE bifunctional protein kinase chain/domain
MRYLEIIEKMGKVRALTVGDAMQDQYVFCRTERMCPEAPVPVLIKEKTEFRNGGASHTADQMLALCQTSWNFFGAVSTKRRYMVGNHMVMREDEDKISVATDAQKIEGLLKHLKESPRYDVVVISDYAKGFVSEAFCKWIIDYCRKQDIICVVDPKGSNWSKYEGCSMICPNMAELKAWEGPTTCAFNFMLLKAGEAGVTLYTPAGADEFPARAKHVFDVTGAGDIVVAVMAAAMAAGAKLVQGAYLANLAAGWSVGEIGAVLCVKDKLIQLVQESGEIE